jgi:3',5'-cyclic AMP phosphodiesterase CpdA
VSCEKIDQPSVTENLAIKLNDQVSSGHLKIAVVSDPHYLHSSLLINNAENGAAFQKDLVANPNKALMAYSASIFKSVFVDLIKEKPDVLLIPGDLTKDGELVSHEQMAGYLNMLREKGIKVFVVPGNNDIRNKDAVGYNGDFSYPVTNISPEQFRNMYMNHGYGDAIARDDASLSYVAELVPGLRLLAIDACMYNPVGSRGGHLSSKTQMFIYDQLNKARDKNIPIIAMMHHSLIEHMTNENLFIRNTVLDSSQAVAEAMMSLGLEVIFTGHGHSNDITQYVKGSGILYDISTGSTLTFPSQFRMVTLKNKEMQISTQYVTEIAETLPEGQKFTDYAEKLQAELFGKYFYPVLKGSPFKMSDSLALATAPLAGSAYMAFIAGDERMSPAEQAWILELENYDPQPKVFLMAAKSFWTDLGINDNKWHFKLFEK